MFVRVFWVCVWRARFSCWRFWLLFCFLLLLCSTVLLYLHFYRSCYIQYNVLNKFSLFFLDLIQPQPPYQMRTFFLYLSLDLEPLFFVPSLVSEPKHRTKKHHFVCITSTSRPLIVVSFFRFWIYKNTNFVKKQTPNREKEKEEKK